MNRIAIIDLGSNSIRFIIMEISKDGVYRLIYQEKKPIRLAEGMTLKSPLLTEHAQERALHCLQVYRHIADAYQVTKIIAVATAAVRNAHNGSSFLKKVRSLTHIPMTIISGKQEAALGFIGVLHTIPMSDFILFDLGGASLEISLVQNHKRIHSVSIPIGALTLTEKFKTGGHVSPSIIKNIQNYIKERFTKIPWLAKAKLPLIGIGGTVRNLGKIYQRKANYPLPKVHQYQISAKNLLPLITHISQCTPEERRKIPGLSPERNDIITAGALIIGELIKYTQTKYITISGCGLREGLFYHWYAPIYDPKGETYKNMLISSTRNFYNTFPHENDKHTRFVTALALSLFDQWQQTLQLPNYVRNILYTAALLHDTGKYINYYNHEKHSTYMISHARIYGWTHKEQIMCAVTCAFHHRFSAKVLKSIPEISILNEKDLIQVKTISCILALAEALDAGYDESISQIIGNTKKEILNLRVYLKGNHLHIYQYTTKQITETFRKIINRPLHIEWYPDSQKQELIQLMADLL